MTDLITRLSKLDAPDREVDAEIAIHLLGYTRVNRMEKWPEAQPIWDFYEGEPLNSNGVLIPRYTGSLDAIRSLARRLYPDAMYRVGNDGEGPDPSLYLGELFIPGEQKDSYFTGVSPVDAVSLCIALLRAKEAGKP